VNGGFQPVGTVNLGRRGRDYDLFRGALFFPEFLADMRARTLLPPMPVTFPISSDVAFNFEAINTNTFPLDGSNAFSLSPEANQTF
jgi:hypothetical protein